MEGIHEDKLEDSLTASSDLKEKKKQTLCPFAFTLASSDGGISPARASLQRPLFRAGSDNTCNLVPALWHLHCEWGQQ